MKIKQSVENLARRSLIVLATCLPLGVQAGPLALSDVPLYLTNAVEPNMLYLLDDSGSMDWEILIDIGTPTGLGVGVLTGYYILPSPTNDLGDNPAANNFPNTVVDEDSFLNSGVWRLKNADFNSLFYDPTKTYSPWPGTTSGGAALFSDAPPDAAPADPTDPGAGTLDLTQPITFQNRRDDTGLVYTETIFPAKYYTWNDTNNDGVIDATDGHLKVEILPAPPSTGGGSPVTPKYPGGPDRSDCVNKPTCSYDEEIQNFANWYTYYRKRSYIARASVGTVIASSNAVRSGLQVFNRGLRQPMTSMSTVADRDALLVSLYESNFDCTSTDCPSTPARGALSDLGQYYKGPNSPLLDADSGGSCQRNFNIIVSDGFWNGTLTQEQANRYGNEDGDNNSPFDGGPYGDEQEETLADIAMYYYENDLDTTLPDNVRIVPNVDEATHQHLVTYAVAFGAAGSLDPFGNRTPNDDSDTEPTDNNFSWPIIVPNTALTVDDLWHAAFNGRGRFLSAKSPDALTSSLEELLRDISSSSASSSAVALDSGNLSSGNLLFQARFQSSDWSGQLLAYSIQTTGPSIGSIGALQWDASCKLTGGICAETGGSEPGQNWNTGRQILTYKPSTRKGVPFRWPTNPSLPGSTDIDTAQVNALKTNPDTLIQDPDTVGEDRLEFLRGRTGIAGFRDRANLLGDIINSNPWYVGAPSFAYPDSLESSPYSAFAAANASRQPMLYVGANDGMLHGFAASTGPGGGEERIAYVPSTVYNNLSALTSTSYGAGLGHFNYVDGPPTAGDVFFNGSWKTILVGGLGRGGQGLYALDVTNPSTSNFSENNADSLVLWEFTDADDSDLGFTFGQPAIIRLANGKWAAAVGNGYNNTEADSSVSSTGNGVLYLIDVEDGSTLKKFDTGVGVAEDPLGAQNARPNGINIATPIDFDGDRIVDFIYASDLFGNVWKIDVRDTDASQWDFAHKLGANPQPFYVAKDANGVAQPITTGLQVTLHPTQPGQIVLFGTGKYIEDGDNVSTQQQTQTFYGVWDRNEPTNGLSVITRTHLLQQSITQETPFNSSTVRITTDTPISWHTTGGLPPSGGGHLGWYMDLLNTGNGNTDNFGERVVANPLLRDGKIVFVTLVPLTDPCDSGGFSWTMEVDAFSGARLLETPFDLNGDGVFTEADLATLSDGTNVAASGIKSTDGILSTPGILRDRTASGTDGGREFKYFSSSTGSVETLTENRGRAATGRQSWREIFDN